MNRIVLLLMCALVATLATTGCKKGTPRTTTIPGISGQPTDQTDTKTVQNPIYNPPTDPNAVHDTGIPLPSNDIFAGMIPDRAALKAYTIHFAFDSAVVKKTEQSKLDSVANWLKNNPGDKLLIEGNCDERGTKEYNMSLGERRALAAREALASMGIDPMRIGTKSFGKDNPVDTAHNDAAFTANRRDDFVVYHPKM